MEEAEASPVSDSPLTPEEELDEEQIFANPENLKLSEEKQKKVLIKYIQEKRELQEQLETKGKEIQDYKVKVYDLSNKNKELQQEIANLKKNTMRVPPLSQANRTNNAGGRSPALNRTGIVRPSTTRKPARAKTATKKKTKPLGKIEKQDSVSTNGTPEPNDQQLENDSAAKILARYQVFAQKFPDLKLSVIIRAEQVFCDADINHDGTIDEDELEKLLEKQGHYMTTKKEVREIMKDIDKDDTGTIDLMEYMAVMERVQLRKRTNLPPQLTKSGVCAIQ